MSDRLLIISNHVGKRLTSDTYNSSTKSKLEDPLEFLKIEGMIPGEFNKSRKEFRKILEKEVVPILPEYFEKGEFPLQILPKLKTVMGLMKESYGCKKLSSTEKNWNLYELARVDGSLATFILESLGLVVYTIEHLGSEEQKAKYLPALCNFDLIGCWGLTEPNFGSDASGLKTSATPVEGGFEISGEKRWIGSATISDIMIIWARNSQTKEIEGFIIPTKSKGVRVQNIGRKLAMRIIQNGHIYMDKVFVPSNARLEKGKRFLEGTSEVLQNSRVSIPWIAVGIMSGVYEYCLKYTSDHYRLSAPISSYQLAQEKLVRILGYIQASLLLGWRIDQLRENGSHNRPQSSLTKAWTTLIGREVCKLASELVGENGIIIDNFIMKAMTDMEVVHTYEGTYEVNALITGRDITGIAAFKSPFKL